MGKVFTLGWTTSHFSSIYIFSFSQGTCIGMTDIMDLYLLTNANSIALILLVKKWAVNSRLNVLCAHFFTFYTGKSNLLSEVIG